MSESENITNTQNTEQTVTKPTAPVSNLTQPEQKNPEIPGKFKSITELAKAYEELEKKLGSKTEAKENTKPEQTVEFYSDLPTELHRFQDSFIKNGGKLLDSDYADLQKMGISKKLADDHIKMQQELASLKKQSEQHSLDQSEEAVVKDIGGREAYESLKKWAIASIDRGELEAFNEIMRSGNTTAAKLAVNGLYARYRDAEGRAAKLVKGQSAVGTIGYASEQEMMRDMRNPLYKQDPAFRESVRKKLSVTDTKSLSR